MVQEILTFGNIEIEKYKTYPYKSPIYLDVNSALVSKKVSFGEKYYKYFICYLYDDCKIKPLYIMLPKTSAYVCKKCYDDQTKWMYFLIEDDNLSEKYNTILVKVSSDIKNWQTCLQKKN